MLYEKDLKDIARVVEIVMATNPGARANDRILLVNVWKRYGVPFSQDQYKALMKAPTAETITRIRRKLQQQGRYLPEETVAEYRHNKAGVFKQEMINWDK